MFRYRTNAQSRSAYLTKTVNLTSGPQFPELDGGFIAANGANAPMYSAVHSPAFYDAGLNKTYVAWEAWTGVRSEQITSLDHDTGYFSDIEGVGQSYLVDDEHGNPVIVMDHEKHLHVFYGAHANLTPDPKEMKHSSTRWPEDGVALSGSKWAIQPGIAGLFTYPHPVLVGSGFHLFMRSYIAGDVSYPLVLYKTTSLADGVATWGAEQTILDFGADSRVYQGTTLLVGTDIHFVCSWAEGTTADERKHVYYLVYDTVTGALCNHNKSFSVASGSLPMSLAQANTNCRIFEHSVNNGCYLPAMTFDTNGDPYVVINDGVIEDSTFDIKVIKRTSGTWDSPVTVAPNINAKKFYHFALGPLPDAKVELVYVVNNDAWPTRGGDIMRRVRSTSGTWGAETVILRATTHGLGNLNAIRDADLLARFVFCEITQDALDLSAGDLKIYMWGSQGLIEYRQAPETVITSVTDGNELREDDSFELREDNDNELREVAT